MLFTLRPASQDSWDHAEIVAQSVASGERIVLIERGRDERYIPTGHLVYGLNGALLGTPFDARSASPGPPCRLSRASWTPTLEPGRLHFAVSNDGTLVYLSGVSGGRSTLSRVRRDGRRARR